MQCATDFIPDILHKCISSISIILEHPHLISLVKFHRRSELSGRSLLLDPLPVYFDLRPEAIAFHSPVNSLLALNWLQFTLLEVCLLLVELHHLVLLTHLDLVLISPYLLQLNPLLFLLLNSLLLLLAEFFNLFLVFEILSHILNVVGPLFVQLLFNSPLSLFLILLIFFNLVQNFHAVFVFSPLFTQFAMEILLLSVKLAHFQVVL